MKAGEQFEVALEAVPGSGFIWELESGVQPEGPVQLVGMSTEPGSRDVVGGQSTQPQT